MHIDIQQADQRIQYFDAVTTESHLGLFRVTDLLTDKSQVTFIDSNQAAALFWLIIQGDPDAMDLTSSIPELMYEIAEPVIKDWEHELRPIP